MDQARMNKEKQQSDQVRRVSTQQVPTAEAAVLGLQRLVGNSAVAQRLTDPEAAAPGMDHDAVHDVLRLTGQPLANEVRADVEDRLGSDFSDVQVHTDANAHAAAESIQANAFTSGSHIVFQRGQYNPTSPAGKRMLLHELRHVDQQRSGPVSGTDIGGGLNMSDPGDSFERDADATAAQAMSEPPSPVTE